MTVSNASDDAAIKQRLLSAIKQSHEEIGVTNFSHLNHIIVWNIRDVELNVRGE